MGACTLNGAACTPDATSIAINGFDPACDPSFCGNVVAPGIGEDPCANLAGDPISYAQCENALYNKATGAPPPPPLGVNPWDSVWLGYRGPTSLGQIPGAGGIAAGLGGALLLIAIVALAPTLLELVKR